jgi:ribonuclease HII
MIQKPSLKIKKSLVKIENNESLWETLPLESIVGVDEVGRGCLAGPVYAAAVLLNPVQTILDYKDSKLLSEIRRKELSLQIQQDHRWSLGIATVEEISSLNILKASLLAMKRAVIGLGSVENVIIFVDGNQKILGLPGHLEQHTVVKGDQRVKAIAAASIVAKVARDEWMQNNEKKYPGYGFEKHKGYGTPEHKKAIQDLGPCEIHRPTFSGVKEYIQKSNPWNQL